MREVKGPPPDGPCASLPRMCPAPHRADPIWGIFHRDDQDSPNKTKLAVASRLAVGRGDTRPHGRELSARLTRVCVPRGRPPGARRAGPHARDTFTAAADHDGRGRPPACLLMPTQDALLRRSLPTLPRAQLPGIPSAAPQSMAPPEAVDSRRTAGIVSARGRSFWYSSSRSVPRAGWPTWCQYP